MKKHTNSIESANKNGTTAPSTRDDTYTGDSYRYPGARPFSVRQSSIFFGRDPDIRNLYQMIKMERLVVLHARSGLGKSSLINAGIIPLIEKDGEFTPITIRFGAYRPENEMGLPLDITRGRIESKCKADKSFFPDLILSNDRSLWYLLMREHCLTGGAGKFLLIFDQFEELFTYPEAAIHAFKAQLAELLYTNIPERFRQPVEQEVESPNRLNRHQLSLIHRPLEVHILFAIRSDRISQLDHLSSHLPLVKRSWYELDALTEQQAEEAILNPAYKKGTFASPVFDYDDDAIDEILRFLTRDHKEKIESFQLQILCQSIERKVIGQHLSLVTLSDMGNIQEVYENYYEDQIRSLGREEDQQAARRFIENGLIFEEEQRRISLYEGQIHKEYGISDTLLRRLVDTHLIRREPSSKGGFLYELSHDTLVAPVLKAKAIRLAAEAEAATEAERAKRLQELTEARRKAQDERELRQKAEVNERKAKSRLVWAFIASLVVLALGVFATGAWFKAQRSMQAEQTAREEAEKQKELAIRSEEQAILEKQTSDSLRIIASNAEAQANKERDMAEMNFKMAERARERMYIALEKEEASRHLAEMQRDSIGKLKDEANTAKDLALQNEKEAQKQKIRAEEAAQKAYRLGRIAQSRSLALKSLQTGRENSEPKAQLALEAWKILSTTPAGPGQEIQPDIYKALYESVKYQSTGENYNRYAHAGMITDLVFHPANMELWLTSPIAPPRLEKMLPVPGELVRLEFRQMGAAPDGPAWQNTLATAPSRQLLAVGGRGPEMLLFNTMDWESTVIDLPGDLEVYRIAFNEDATLFYAAASDGRIYEVTTDGVATPLFSCAPQPEALSLSGHWLIAGNGNGELFLYDLKNRQKQALHTFSDAPRITALQAYFKDKKLHMAAGFENGTIKLLRQEKTGSGMVETDTLYAHRARISLVRVRICA